MKKLIAFTALGLLAVNTGAQTIESQRSHRIIGGENAPTSVYPWMVSVQSKLGAEHFCGASLIASQWVLTAAHCVESEVASGIQVSIADHDLSKNDSGEQLRDVSDIYIHQQYGDDHDIALLKLTAASDKTPVALADANFMANLADGTELTTIGWGLTRDGDDGSLPNILQQVKVPLFAQASCKTNYAPLKIEITNNMVCAGLDAGGKDSCQGDSGGPLFVESGGSMVQLGVTSFGEGCAVAKFPGVYTRVAAYRDWITKAQNGEVPAHQGGGSGGETIMESVLGLPAYLDMFVKKNDTSVAATVTLTNPQDAKENLMVNEVAVTGDGFSLKQNGCDNQAIEAGKGCDITLQYQASQGTDTAEGQLSVKTNHAQHSEINVELYVINGNEFDAEMNCSLMQQLGIESGDCDASDKPSDNSASDNKPKEDDDDDDNKLLGALNPWMLLGLLLLPVVSRRR